MSDFPFLFSSEIISIYPSSIAIDNFIVLMFSPFPPFSFLGLLRPYFLKYWILFIYFIIYFISDVSETERRSETLKI